jgi:hypothetical protein
MKWLKDFFFCNTWREFFAHAVLASAMAIHRVLGFTGVCVCDVRIVCYMV